MQLKLSKGKLSKGKSPYLPFSNVTKIFDHHTHGTAFLCVYQAPLHTMPRLLEKSCQGIERQLERNHEEKKSVTNQSSKKIRWIVRGKQLLDIDRINATIKLSAIRDYHSFLWNKNDVKLKKKLEDIFYDQFTLKRVRIPFSLKRIRLW